MGPSKVHQTTPSSPIICLPLARGRGELTVDCILAADEAIEVVLDQLLELLFPVLQVGLESALPQFQILRRGVTMKPRKVQLGVEVLTIQEQLFCTMCGDSRLERAPGPELRHPRAHRSGVVKARQVQLGVKLRSIQQQLSGQDVGDVVTTNRRARPRSAHRHNSMLACPPADMM
jgi:hypothetical protein